MTKLEHTLEQVLVFQLVYVSRAAMDIDLHSLDEILALARCNNANRGVTGMLLYHDGAFIQVLEGEEQTVEQTFAKIQSDSRHTDANVVLRTSVPERAFDDWSMGYKRTDSLSDVPEGFHHFLSRGYRQQKEADNEAARKALLSFREGRWRL